MNAVDRFWLVRLFPSALTHQSRQGTRPHRTRRAIPGVEPFEAVLLLSASSSLVNSALARSAAAHRERSSGQPVFGLANHAKVHYSAHTSSDEALVNLPAQTLSLGSTLTNFANEPLSPDLNLFDSSLGTLLSVTVSHSTKIQSSITSQNLSPSSPTTITAALSGSYQTNGLNQPISQPTKTIMSQPIPAGEFGSGTDTVIFPPPADRFLVDHLHRRCFPGVLHQLAWSVGDHPDDERDGRRDRQRT
jgi:hypothetical protein